MEDEIGQAQNAQKEVHFKFEPSSDFKRRGTPRTERTKGT